MAIRLNWFIWLRSRFEPLFRRALVRDYRQHFKSRILPVFKDVRLAALSTKQLNDFRVQLLRSGLSVKSARNILDASFRALYRDARTEIEELQGKDPFLDVRWPRLSKKKPDPFSAEERDRIIAWYVENDFFFYPLVAWQFYTGMRPSETFALTWRDIDFFRPGVFQLTNRATWARPPQRKPQRAIGLFRWTTLLDILKLMPSRELGLDHVFVGKRGEPMSKKWAEHSWAGPLKKLKIPHRKFYACRHTAITELVRAEKNLKAIADYVGTSVAMIEDNYWARQGFNLGRTEVAHDGEKTEQNVVAGPGFEPGTSRL